VHFAQDIPTSEITAYVDSQEPYDKAGSYGIQTKGGAYVRSIDGCYHNVMGFPLHRFCALLRQILPAMMNNK